MEGKPLVIEANNVPTELSEDEPWTRNLSSRVNRGWVTLFDEFDVTLQVLVEEFVFMSAVTSAGVVGISRSGGRKHV